MEIFAWNCSKFISLWHEGMVVPHAIRLWLRLVLGLRLGLGLLTAWAFCTFVGHDGGHSHWVGLFGLGGAILAGIFEHGFENLLVLHKVIQLAWVPVGFEQLFCFFLGIELRIDLEILENIDEMRVDNPRLVLISLHAFMVADFEYAFDGFSCFCVFWVGLVLLLWVGVRSSKRLLSNLMVLDSDVVLVLRI